MPSRTPMGSTSRQLNMSELPMESQSVIGHSSAVLTNPSPRFVNWFLQARDCKTNRVSRLSGTATSRPVW